MIFARWSSMVTDHSLRLRLTYSQTIGTGLTSFLCIGLCRDFNWNKITILLPGEVAAFTLANGVIAGNHYLVILKI